MKQNINFSGARIRISLLLAISMLFTLCTRPVKISQEHYDKIQEGFITPADTNKPWCYYYWIGDDISKEGITNDLEAMKDFGLGAVLIGNINPDEVDGPVPLFSDQWWDAMVHVVNEGHRIGIDIGFFNCPGWSQSGGPWVSYDKAMRHLVYSETTVTGGGDISVRLPKPAEEFQDTYVLGFRKIASEDHYISKQNAFFTRDNNNPYVTELSSATSITARSIRLTPATPAFKCKVELQARVDGKYKSIKSFVFDRSNSGVNVGPVTHGPVAISLPDTEAKAFRLLCSNAIGANRGLAPGFVEIRISETDETTKTILLLTEEKGLRDLLSQDLEEAGYLVISVADGTNLLALARTEQPDLILLDLVSREPTGFDVAMVLKQDPYARKIPLLFLTSVSDPEDGLRMGAVGFMIRPEGTGRLLSAIDAILVSGINPSSRVLVIEPEKSTRESMILLIQAQGFRVTEARGAEEAIALAERVEPGLVLVNSDLAQERDYWLLRSLRQISGDIDIYVLADVMSEEEGQAALSRGASGYSETGSLREILEDRRDWTPG